MMLDYLLISLLVLYLVQVAVFTAAARRTRDEQGNISQPFISVLIAARNEESNLSDCLKSVLNQSYDTERYEVIVINDHSTDGTESICQEFALRFHNFSYANAREDSTLRGKTNALDQGIEKARGEIILVTDADCSVPRTWVEWTARRYSNSVGMVGGITLQKAGNWFEGMQSLDWAFLLGLASATVSLRHPLSTIGNNLSFRKAAYGEVGGYRKIPFSVTEDFMLFRSIVKTKNWDYLCPIDPNVLVVSQPCSSWKELFRQKQRWGKGGLDMKLSGFSIMAIGFGLNAMILLSPVLGNSLFALGALLFKMAGDYSFLRTVLKKLGRLDHLKYFSAFQAYFFLYVLVLPFIVFLGGKVVWKGRKY
ncbi:MAG: glycosyltransferase [Ignavibacteriales bacterium]|nr:glycosyltransferase [Ignavibacteriales bacterium]